MGTALPIWRWMVTPRSDPLVAVRESLDPSCLEVGSRRPLTSTTPPSGTSTTTSASWSFDRYVNRSPLINTSAAPSCHQRESETYFSVPLTTARTPDARSTHALFRWSDPVPSGPKRCIGVPIRSQPISVDRAVDQGLARAQIDHERAPDDRLSQAHAAPPPGHPPLHKASESGESFYL